MGGQAHHGRTERQLAATYAEERPSLQPLRVEPFRHYQFGERTVHLDVARRNQRRLLRRTAGLHRTHPACAVGRRARPADGPAHQTADARVQGAGARSLPNGIRLPAQAHARHHIAAAGDGGQRGRTLRALCAAIHRDMGELGVKRILGVRSLLRRMGLIAVDDACAAALEMGVPGYRFVRCYLERQPRPPMALRQIVPLIRELTHHGDHINRITKET